MTRKVKQSKHKITTKNDVFKKATENHLWLNAFACINPTPEYCEQIGRIIIEKLNDKEQLIPSYFQGAKNNKHIATLAELTPVLYLSINKS